jgi:hypothetical protein
MAIVNLNVDYAKRKIVGSVNGNKPDDTGNVEVDQNRVQTINSKTPDGENGNFTIWSTFMKDIASPTTHELNLDIDPSKQLVVQTVNGKKPDIDGDVITISSGTNVQVEGINNDYDFINAMSALPELLIGDCFLRIGNDFPRNIDWTINVPNLVGSGTFFIKGSPTLPTMTSITVRINGGTSLIIGLDFFAASKYTFINNNPGSHVKVIMTNCSGFTRTISGHYIEVNGCDLSLPTTNNFSAITLGTDASAFIHATSGAKVHCPLLEASWPEFSAPAPTYTNQGGGGTDIYLGYVPTEPVGTHVCTEGGRLQIVDSLIHPVPATPTPPTKK